MLLWKFMWNKIKWNQKFNSSIILTTSQVLNSHTWLVNYHSVLWHRYRTFPSSQIILPNSVAQCSYCHERLGRVGRMACLKLSKLCALVSCPGLFLLEAFHPTGHPSPLDGARVWSQGLWASPVRAGSVCVPHGKIGTSLSNRMMPSHLLVRIMKTGHYQKRKQAQPQCRATHPLYGTFHLPTWTRTCLKDTADTLKASYWQHKGLKSGSPLSPDAVPSWPFGGWNDFPLRVLRCPRTSDPSVSLIGEGSTGRDGSRETDMRCWPMRIPLLSCGLQPSKLADLLIFCSATTKTCLCLSKTW